MKFDVFKNMKIEDRFWFKHIEDIKEIIVVVVKNEGEKEVNVQRVMNQPN